MKIVNLWSFLQFLFFYFCSDLSTFSVNNIALVNGRPEMLNLKDLIVHFVDHRHDVVVRRTKYELQKAEDRAHILEGLIIASDNIDEVIALIRASSNAEEAREKLMDRFELTEVQARAIVEMRLRQLTGLEQDKLRAEYEEILKTIEDLKDILARKERRMEVIKNELLDLLVFSQCFSESDALVCSITHEVKRALSLSKPAHAMENSSWAETVLSDLKSVPSRTKQILLRNTYVVVINLVVAVKFTHHRNITDDVVTDGLGGDDDHREGGMRRRIVWLGSNHGRGISRGPRT